MMHKKISLRLVALLLGLAIMGISAPAVSALEETTEPQEPTTNTTTDQLRAKELQRRQAALEKKNKREQELKEKRKQQCAAKAEGVNTAFKKITENRRRIFTRLTEISDKVQAFVTNKQLTVENYDQLVATVTERKSTAEASINQVHAVNTLSCNDIRSPKDQFKTFREKRQGSIDALKEYRTAIKKLILAVKSSIASHKGLEGQHTGEAQKPDTTTGEAQ